VDTQPGQGSTFRVFLPAIAGSAPAPAAARPQPRGGTETILLAEDDASVRKATVMILRHRGYRVLEAASGAEALQVWAEHRDAVALLFTDLVMPGGLSGRQLAQKLQTEKPGLKVIYASGYSAEIAGREIQLTAGENFVQKPLHPEVLLKTIRSCLDA
jgi:CheY-like chemotaxis protein